MHMTESVSGRLPEALVRELDRLADAAGQTRSEALRAAVQRGVHALRLERGIEAYRRNEASLGRAAEIAGVHLTTFLDTLRREGVPFHYRQADLLEDLEWADEA